MLKRNITYDDGDGNMVTEMFEFHLTIQELVRLLGGNEEMTMEEAIKELEKRDIKDLVLEFDNFILSSYGVRSEDKKRFIKNDELREQFADSFAYNALFTEFMMTENAFNDFVIAILPQNLKGEFQKIQAQIETVPGPDIARIPQPPQIS